MAVDFKTFSTIVGFVTDVKKPVLLRGRHGIGKSTVVYSTLMGLAKQLLKEGLPK